MIQGKGSGFLEKIMLGQRDETMMGLRGNKIVI
jgi:hypothetical protein